MEARNAPDNDVVVPAAVPRSDPSDDAGQRTFIAQPRSPYGQPQHQVDLRAPRSRRGLGAGGSSVFGRMTTGQVIEMVAQIFAALMPLPGAAGATSDATPTRVT